MKESTILVCSKSNVKNHVGEKYDEFFIVDNTPNIENMEEFYNRITDNIRRIATENDSAVRVFLDAPQAYFSIIVNAQHEMRENENITVITEED